MKRQRRPRRQIGYRLNRTTPARLNYRDSPEFCHLYIEVYIGDDRDAAKEYEQTPDAYYLDRLQKIRDAGKSNRYLYASDTAFTLRWQTDCEAWKRNSGGRWYAGKFEDLRMRIEAMTLAGKVTKIVEAHYETTPDKILAALESLGARRVTYCDPMSSWVYVDDSAADFIALSPWPELDAQEATEPESAASA